jgi:hypothetical protein
MWLIAAALGLCVAIWGGIYFMNYRKWKKFGTDDYLPGKYR